MSVAVMFSSKFLIDPWTLMNKWGRVENLRVFLRKVCSLTFRLRNTKSSLFLYIFVALVKALLNKLHFWPQLAYLISTTVVFSVLIMFKRSCSVVSTS
jgi:hypothetical protein